jgi:cell division protein FtsQ
MARIVAWMVALALVATPIVAVLNGWLAHDRWPVRELVMHGPFDRLDEEDVGVVVAPMVAEGFFAIDLDALKSAVERLPWVERAEVRKQWPDRIQILVDERVPIALWREDRLLSSRGQVFAADLSAVPTDLPRLDGPDARAGEIWEQHRAARERLARVGFDIRATRMDARGAWSLSSVDGAEFVLGREQTAQRLERLVTAMQRLPAEQLGRVARVDLRYANGFSVVWRAAPDPDVTPHQVPEQSTEKAHEPQV